MRGFFSADVCLSGKQDAHFLSAMYRFIGAAVSDKCIYGVQC